MDKCQKYFDLLLDGSYQQMSGTQKKHIEEAMDHNCLQEFIKMKETLNIMSQAGQADPGQDYWDRYWRRSSPRFL